MCCLCTGSFTFFIHFWCLIIVDYSFSLCYVSSCSCTSSFVFLPNIMCMYIRVSVLLHNCFLCSLYPFCSKLKHIGSISIPAVDGFCFPNFSSVQKCYLISFLYAEQFIIVFLTKTKHLCPDELDEF